MCPQQAKETFDERLSVDSAGLVPDVPRPPDGLTTYLATSPGGIDSVAIIAASTPTVNLPFVLGLQSVRLLFVIGLAPLITRLVVRLSPHLQN